MATLSALLRTACQRLDSSPTPELDARLLLCHLLGVGSSFLYGWPEHPLSATQQQQFEALIERRRQGEPIAYLTGRQGFWDLELRVDATTLIPRPETELLVELTLQRLPTTPLRLADLGTGSGAIALALAKARPAWQLVATDASPAALHVARDNAATLNLAHRVCFQQGDWCDALPAGRFAALVSNPPYIAADDPHLAALGFEPATALVAAENGLADLRRIAEQAPAHLLSGGWLLLEHGWQQGAAVRDLLSRLGYHQIETHHDLGGQERVTSARIGEEHTDG
ncbi:MAG TPA: peptide chain release factor N(5)-glutamine methyltransferase [Pseudomonadales bacterium]|mgnify:FL=1|nr:peptide chain release factor N(5)-glutamine methyltransferase [Pseudomonadales bacterium]